MSPFSISHQSFSACFNKLVTKHQFTGAWSHAGRGQEKLSPTADCWDLINHPSDPSKQIISKLQRKATYSWQPDCAGGSGRRDKFCLESFYLVTLRNQYKLWNTGCLQYEEDAHKLQFSLMSVFPSYNTTLDIQKLVLQFPVPEIHLFKHTNSSIGYHIQAISVLHITILWKKMTPRVVRTLLLISTLYLNMIILEPLLLCHYYFFQLNSSSLSLILTSEHISEESSYPLSTFVCLGLTNHLI